MTTPKTSGAAPARQQRLGRGIGALLMPDDDRPLDQTRPSDVYFGRANEPADDLQAAPGLRLVALAPGDISPNPQQPRREFDEEAMAELVVSVQENGVLQPIVVRPLAETQGKYELVMGERRLRAAKEAGLRTIPAVIKQAGDDQMLQEALLENLHRVQLTPLEEASAYQQLIEDFGVTHEELGMRIGRNRTTITNTIRLLRLPEHIQRKVASGVITPGHARAVLSVVDPELMDRLVEKIVTEDLNVRQSEAAAIRLAGPTKPKKATGRRHEGLDHIADKLGSRFDTRVRVDLNAKSGRIVIDFGSVADLNRILEEIGEEKWEEGEARERMLAQRTAALRRK
ncbi:ParB/RepB/Spo0J family partition protein [Amnibacterium kyonggiense]|uniref:ParB family chromosome partitioning protein n=1 Tax=Amnibacterium kyonggiense TaxID=595671 RepID=A0A4R7FPZ0_9MICO|nr:ParB/RepB/Spo0J family partition protein [Amnibacterium kyonggiense]TDS79837.1 ParB family chromosome partitioning protein [Amnibacterium kyonggiense]